MLEAAEAPDLWVLDLDLGLTLTLSMKSLVFVVEMFLLLCQVSA
jgi:hypothetical protein